jgi:hypothetical protein
VVPHFDKDFACFRAGGSDRNPTFGGQGILH